MGRSNMHRGNYCNLDRRRFLKAAGAGLTALPLSRTMLAYALDVPAGRVIGQREGAAAGEAVLASGGNAVDAAVTAALVASVVSLSNCGIGGYGGHLIIARPDGRLAAIDFNSAAPAATREDMYPLDARGKVVGAVNDFGWLAAGVPGTLAGLQLALTRHGTWPLDRALEPAIRFAREGFGLPDGQARAIRAAAPQFERDPASAQLLLPGGKPLAAGETFRNPDLARMLGSLAKNNDVAEFYRGAIAHKIAHEFQSHGGLVTEADLAAYEAREVEPLSFQWRGWTLATPPLTAGGISVLQALSTLRTLSWDRLDPTDPKTAHARVEAMRLAWNDRLTLLGDPNASEIPVAKLLSPDYAEQAARRVKQSVVDEKLIPGSTDGRTAGGTIHLSACDRDGMMVALTLTHGGGFGARVTVDGLGLILGHGMSRFEPRAGHPNSPRPGARPLNNMCPAILLRAGRPLIALGATGGRRIPNTMFDVLSQIVGRDATLAKAAAAPRLHTEGDAKLGLAKGWSDRDVDHLKHVGYTIVEGAGANLNGVSRDPTGGAITSVPASDA
jgi:gamma-glutamyltranspeptidase/glutathione hydrolase